MKHELKIWPQYYCRVADGSKTFEVRKNDRGFQPGDDVVLCEFDPSVRVVFSGGVTPPYEETVGFTGAPNLIFKVGYVLPLDNDRVVFSLLPTPQAGEP